VSILSDYQRHIEQPRIRAYEREIAALRAELAARPSPSVGVGELREKIARIIDPWPHDRAECDPETEEALIECFAKADCILAALSSIPVGGLENRGSVVGSADALSALPRLPQAGSATPSDAQSYAPEPIHPSVFIQEEMDERGWSREELANRMGTERCVRNILVLDLYFEVGPTRTNCRLGEDTARRLAAAFGTSPDLFLNLERAWLRDMGCAEGVAIKPEADGEVSKATQSLQTTEPKTPSTPPSEAG
jgi:plasmid maintenance system antidote protein VapI